MKVLSNTGYQSVSGIRKTIHKCYYEIILMNDDVLKCTSDHIFETLNGPVTAKHLTIYDELMLDGDNTFIKSKQLIRRKFVAYVLIDVENGSLYYTNGVLSHNCSFLGSSNTLIAAAKLQNLAFLDPIAEKDSIKIYEQPQEGHTYVTTVDVCAGLGSDYSVVNVIDVTETPYRQVMVYRNNEIDPTSFAVVVYSLAKKYNGSYLVIESNNDGKIVAKEVWDMEYENLINTRAQEGDNVIKTGKRSVPGIMMTKLTKKIGCSKLKDLVETEVLVLVDAETISECGTFVMSKGSYEAETGKNDDIIMCLVMFAWFSSSNYFEGVTGNNTGQAVKDNRNDDDLHMLLGFVNDGFYEEDYGFSF